MCCIVEPILSDPYAIHRVVLVPLAIIDHTQLTLMPIKQLGPCIDDMIRTIRGSTFPRPTHAPIPPITPITFLASRLASLPLSVL
ncbi:hypothetical protein CBOM_07625 [Ceraceosorus bombacis]|uniref:Uncharacterized protein n=1 Tax=Ceraceosorus bombacis TaxID=401625 RepID=A0A0P1BLG8_9BASI|nr:hypothetical protein CBOM_07625 [Ceraceosorus bombacis]